MTPLVAHAHALFADLSAWEWVLFAAEAAASVWVLWLAIRFTLHPGEEASDHVKRSILDDEAPRPLVSVSFVPAIPARKASP